MSAHPSRREFCSLAALALSLGPLSSRAQDPRFPTKAVTVRVSVPPGGPADNAIRAAQPLLQRTLGQPVLIENQPGASGTIATRSVLSAAPDGHTLLGGPGADFLIAPMIVASARYNPLDFKLIGVTGLSDFVLVASAARGFRDLEGLLAHARKPGNPQLSIAHWGAGSAPHLVAADFMGRTGIHLVDIPYKGAAPVLTDISGGQVDLAFVPLTGTALGMINGKRFMPLAVAGTARNPALPDVPTLSEAASLKGFDHTVWSAIWAPPGTPGAAVERLNAILNEWIASPDSLARLAANASRAVATRSPAENASFLRRQHETIAAIARSLRLAPQ